MLRTLFLTCSILLSGCAWVQLDDAGRSVRVVDSSMTAGCVRKGEVTSSVNKDVGPFERNSQKVADELEALARNEAATMGGNTIVAGGEIVQGQRRYIVWRCN